jgi:predicted alpha-1,2-mannosidase
MSTRYGRFVRSAAAALGVAATVIATAAIGTAAAEPATVADPASLVNPIIGTSGAVDTFPGPDRPFGMLQWSPDTSPRRPDGGGYEYNSSQIRGFSLTHISGPGCPAFGDVPMLPLVGPMPADASGATADFTHSSETAKAGYYKVTTTHQAIDPGLMKDVDEVTASGENPPNEVARNLIDRSLSTKWLTFADHGWVQFRFTDPVAVDDYALSSANDSPGRDPRDWTLQGSQDGHSWTTLDTRAGEDFADRFKTREFSFSNSQAYRYYRLDISANHGDSATQLSEVQLSSGPIPSPSGDPNPVTTELTTTTRAGIAHFRYPASDESRLLLKLTGTATQVDGTSANVVSDREVTGSVTAGHFCGSGSQRDYTLHFDIEFDQPFTAHRPWGRGPGGGPGGVALTFDTTSAQTVAAKVGISFTSARNAADNLAQEIPGWDFDAVRAGSEKAWNDVLRRIEIAGGTHDQQVQFYTALYHMLLHPNVFSDVNGEYAGMDGKTHTAASGHDQYANYSGWDIYRSQVQLAALVAPHETSDSIRSMLADYDQSGMLPKWSQANGESYVMVGDPADPIIAGAHAFGARDFDTRKALDAMVAEATQTSNIRPGQSVLDQYGYLPYDMRYGCCNFYGPVSTQLEYDSADYAIAALAQSLGRRDLYTKFATRAQNWQNVFNPATGYVQAKLENGQWVPGFTPSTGTGMVEGTSAQYTPMVPFNLRALIAARGGNAAWESYLDSLFTNIADPDSTNADLNNEPSVEIPWEYNYVGAPWKTQRVVRQAQTELYANAPRGQFGNDDLGAMSSWYVWSNLGLYPETPGADTLVIGSPLFPHAVAHLANGRDITIDAPKAATDAPYVQSLKLNGKAWPKTYLEGNQYRNGASLAFDLGTSPNKAWGGGPSAAPPSDGTGQRAVMASVDPGSVVLQPGASATATLKAVNVGGANTTASWTAGADRGVSVSPTQGSVKLDPYGSATQKVTIHAADDAADGRYAVTFHVATGGGEQMTFSVGVAVAKPGEIWPYYTNAGITSDDDTSAANYDGGGWSYSADALAGVGVTPGSTVTADGVGYTWPDVPVATLDNIEAAGQTIGLDAPAGATKIGLLGSATNAGSDGAGGMATVTYADGSTSRFTARFSDWTLGAGAFPPLPGNFTAVTMPYRNFTGNRRDAVETHVFALDAPLTAGKTVKSITLPEATGGGMHVFAIGFG